MRQSAAYRTAMKIAGLVAAVMFMARGFMDRPGWVYFGIGGVILLAVVVRQFVFRD